MPSFDDYNPTIRWVHVSDLHMTTEDVNLFNINNVLPKLMQDIIEFDPHFIVFSGDVSYSGQRDEYKAVENNFIKPLLSCRKNLTASRLFFSPGNHDVDWKILDDIIPKISVNFQSQDQLTELFCDPHRFNMLLSAHSSYLQFSNKYGNNTGDKFLPICQVNNLKLKGKKISILSLSSSILSGLVADRCKDSDYGKLAIGEYQVNSLLKKINKFKPDITIAVTHHPLNYLCGWDKKVIENYFFNFFTFHFFGHLHEPDFKCERNKIGNLTSVQTGSIFSAYHHDNIYTQITWALNSNSINVVAKKYNKAKMIWEIIDDSFDISLNAEPEVTTTVEKLPLNISEYKITSSDDFNIDLRKIGLSMNEVLNKLQKTFQAHLNFFKRDYEKLPITLDSEFFILISKIGMELELHRIVSCKKEDLSKVLGWNDIILNYRKCTYFAYREPNYHLLNFTKEFRTALDSHRELRKTIKQYFEKYELRSFNFQNENNLDEKMHLSEFHLRSSLKASEEAEFYMKHRRNYPPEDAINQAILHLETSLMHLHKILLSYFPGDAV